MYLFSTITVNLDDDDDAIDPATGGTTRPIIVRMKQAIGDYFELTPLAFNDPLFTGVFGGNGTNTGAEFRRRLGGFKDAAYTLIAESTFDLTERVRQADGSVSNENRSYRSMTIGFPKGHSVTEVIDWLASTSRIDEIQALISPDGYRTDMFTPD
ncbi:MAG: hypothetical protein ACRCZI_13705 [Cetobacterium sp.]